MKLYKSVNENFVNVPDELYTAVDSTFKIANKEHDENKKRYDDAIKENEKLALETIPKEGETGKKVTSPVLKKMHLSEALFEAVGESTNGIYNLIDILGYEETLEALIRYLSSDVLGDFVEYINRIYELNDYEDDFVNESLTEGKDGRGMHERLVSYLEKFMNVCHISYDAMGDALMSIGKSFKALNPMTESLDESLKLNVIKEQLEKYKNGGMPENWNPNTYLENLVKKNHITKEEASKLKESLN